MEISDTLLGAIIAGGCGVLTAIVGGLIGCWRDVVKSRRERVEQRESEYVNKRIQAYEGFLAYCNAYVSFIKFVQKEMLASRAIELIDKTSIWRDVFKPQEKYLVAVKLYGNPRIYVQVAHFFENVGFERELVESEWYSNVEYIECGLKEIANEMREEIAKLMDAEKYTRLCWDTQLRKVGGCFMQIFLLLGERVKTWCTLTNLDEFCRPYQCWGILVLNIVLASSCYYMKEGFVYDVLLAFTMGLWIYWITIEFWKWRRLRRLKELLHKKHRLFKCEVIRMFLAAVKKSPTQENINMLLSPQAFEEFFLKKDDDGEEKRSCDIVINYLMKNPERLSDLRVEIRLFFESVLSLLMVNDVRLDVLDRVVDFSERYKRIEYNSDLNQDVEYVVNALFYWFADRTQAKWTRGASFVHLINKI